MGGTLSSAATGCDVVNGGREAASDIGAAKVISSMGVEESDASGSALSGSTSPFASAAGALISGGAIPFRVPDGGITVSVVALSRTTLRLGSGGGSWACTREVKDSA